MRAVIVTKIQKMHDMDPNVYTFPDWGNPTGKDVSISDKVHIPFCLELFNNS